MNLCVLSAFDSAEINGDNTINFQDLTFFTLGFRNHD